MLAVPVTVLLIIVAGLVNSQDGTSPASADPKPTTSGLSGDASNSPTPGTSPYPDVADNATGQPNSAKPNRELGSLGADVFLPSRKTLPPDNTPQGQGNGSFRTAGGQPNYTRVPLHQAQIPASVPLKQSRLTYRQQWQVAGNHTLMERYQFRYKKIKVTHHKLASTDMHQNPASTRGFYNGNSTSGGEFK
ncbi:uncharacterized protein LOC129582365 [Paramacrobiotus metropolitanus]|uniref:uncharacterized protein LOC129582365 n=1 Tax=Paramacrobiotus metropolitanus TaxID=2943436 RepID=UPI002445B7F3|nr:uncharacterized protein LOC129582365 [Paramacrobiotus metropolitanus]